MTKGNKEMEKFIKIGQVIIPEGIALLKKRYDILSAIELFEPVGRRTLSNNIGLTERVIRGEVEFLKENRLIDVRTSGMELTPEGREILENLKQLMSQSDKSHSKELLLQQILKCSKVIIVAGDSKNDSYAKKRIGVEAANYISNNIKNDDIIALTGGTTVKSVVDNYRSNRTPKNLYIVPARGGIGKNLELQSNTLVSNLALKLNARYRLLHAPDNMTMETHDALLKEIEIKSTFDIIRKANVVVVGIGTADEMIVRRNLPEKEKNKILHKRAVGEAFGTYFNEKKEAVYKKIALGLSMDDVENIDKVIAVSGGSDKARAIMSVNFGKEDWTLITDEGAADAIISIYEENEGKE